MWQSYIEQATGGKHRDPREASNGAMHIEENKPKWVEDRYHGGEGHSVVGMQVHQIIYISSFKNLSVRPGGLCVSLTSQG